MNLTKEFDAILKKKKDKKGEQLFPNGVYEPYPGDINYDVCKTVQTGINSYLLNNAAYFNLENLHFNFIYSDTTNACATKPPNNFIGFTKGLVDYSFFLFTNIK